MIIAYTTLPLKRASIDCGMVRDDGGRGAENVVWSGATLVATYGGFRAGGVALGGSMPGCTVTPAIWIPDPRLSPAGPSEGGAAETSERPGGGTLPRPGSKLKNKALTSSAPLAPPDETAAASGSAICAGTLACVRGADTGSGGTNRFGGAFGSSIAMVVSARPMRTGGGGSGRGGSVGLPFFTAIMFTAGTGGFGNGTSSG
jgi:hypothetical protein